MKKAFVLILAFNASYAHAGAGFDNSYEEGGYVIYENPTYNGEEINNNPNTLNQWAKELGVNISDINTDIVYECYNSSEAYPDCRDWGSDETWGYNHGKWEKHRCSYEDWSWDDCYNRPVKILVKSANSCHNTEKATYSNGILHIPAIDVTVTDPFTGSSTVTYEADLQFVPGSSPMMFELKGATRK